jgi:hypothetical protein
MLGKDESANGDGCAVVSNRLPNSTTKEDP